MKYRRNKVKREHGIIQNALPWLENLSLLSEVTDIIPGVIEVSHSSERGIVYKYNTQTGCKLLLKSNGSIQEVFVVTKNPACVEEWIKNQFQTELPALDTSLSSKPEKPKKLANGTQKSKSKTSKLLKIKPTKTSIDGQYHSQKRPYGGIPKTILNEQDASKIGDQLDKETRKALRNLKSSLENTKKKGRKNH
ncbi:MAG: DUF2103 domain-containing protein [Bacillota bacterium]|nr:DUF2103 domain-containing protein [Bacillota bacterium]